MEQTEEKFLVSLLEKDPELKKYYQEHLELEDKLHSYQEKPYLTTEEQIERKKLQKRKLIGKDKIMEILKKYRQH